MSRQSSTENIDVSVTNDSVGHPDLYFDSHPQMDANKIPVCILGDDGSNVVQFYQNNNRPLTTE